LPDNSQTTTYNIATPGGILYDARMFRRLLTLWLIVSALGYNTAWAFDGHLTHLDSQLPSTAAGGDHLAQAATPADPVSDHEQGPCDHCCHASAHMLGLHPSLSDNHFDATSADLPGRVESMSFLALPPLERPPTV